MLDAKDAKGSRRLGPLVGVPEEERKKILREVLPSGQWMTAARDFRCRRLCLVVVKARAESGHDRISADTQGANELFTVVWGEIGLLGPSSRRRR